MSFKVYAKQSDAGRLEIEVMDRYGSRPVRLIFTSEGKIHAVDGSKTIALQSYKANTWMKVGLSVDTKSDSYSVSIDGIPILKKAALAESVLSVERLSFRTGEYRTGPSRTTDPEQIHVDLAGADERQAPVTYYVDDVTGP